MSEPNYAEPPRPGPHKHGGPDCDCHRPIPPQKVPVHEATDMDRAQLGLPVVSVPTLAELNPCEHGGDPVAAPKTPFDHLYNLVQNMICPHYGPQMRYPGGPSLTWMPCGTCGVCSLKRLAFELRSKLHEANAFGSVSSVDTRGTDGMPNS